MKPWQGEDAWIIGGGPSLATFDWSVLIGKHVIGCNSAFILGRDVVETVIFGDWAWWDEIGRKALAGKWPKERVVGCCHALSQKPEKDVTIIPRHRGTGIGTDALAFAGNTGALAINLALVRGAKRVFLLGFDMKLCPAGNPNWHDIRHEPGRASDYVRFKLLFKEFASAIPGAFPGAEVWNVTDSSELECFPKVALAEHFGRIK